MPEMNNSDLITILNGMQQDAVINQDAFITENEELLRRYKGDPYGNEKAGKSSVVSQDVQDTVESDMPSLARMFLGSNEIFTFQPTTANERDVAEAEEKSKYVDWLIRKQPDSFRIQHGFLKDISIQKMGVLKYFFEETESTEEHEYKGVSIEEAQEIAESLTAGNGDFEIEVVSRGEPDENGEFDVTFKVDVRRQEVKIIGVPTESFLISQNASCEDDADLVGDTVTKSRGQLVAEGHSKELVAKLTMVLDDGNTNNNNMQQIRFEDEGGSVSDEQFRQWANEKVELSDLYVRVDVDGDGIAERRHIQKSGDEILVNEPFDHVPYAMASGILMAHKAIGKSRAEVVVKTAEVKTALTRQMLDNGYKVNNPKMAVNKNANIDDMLNDTIGGVARFKGEANPAQNFVPLEVPFIGDKTLLLLQHMDQVKAKSVGDQLSSQGLNADQLGKETATRFKGVEQAAEAKIELVARVIAETGYRKLYEGVAWMVTKYQTTEREFSILGKPLTSNPSRWRFSHALNSEIGLGAGDSEKTVENMTGIWQIQQGLKLQGSSLVDAEKEYNTLTKLSKALEIKDVSKFFNNPEEPDELLMAQNEALNNMVVQLQEQNAQLQNPLAEAEAIKREGDIAIAQGKLALDGAKLQEDKRQFDATMIANLKKQNEDLALKLTELELEHDQDIKGSVV